MSKKYVAAKSFILREIAGQNVLVSVGDGVASFSGVINLNASAALIWKKLIDGADEEELVKALVDEFEVDAETAGTDVAAVIEMLESRGMITIG